MRSSICKKANRFIVFSVLLIVSYFAWYSQLYGQRVAEKQIVFLGNSLTAGYGIDPAKSFPALIQHKIDSLQWPFKVVNAGLSGETTSGGLRRIDWIMTQQIDVLVLELGGNDVLRGIAVDVTKANLQGIIDKTKNKYPVADIVIAGMQAPPNLGNDYLQAFNGIYSHLAKANEALLIPFLLEGVAGVPEMNLPDRIHPTVKGHEIIAENVWTVLKPLLERRL